MPTAINVLTFIDKVELELAGFRKNYDQLSEYAHPNWSGVSGTFTKTDYENILIDFGKNIRGKDRKKLLISISFPTNLEIFVMIYNEFAEFLPKLIELCERQIEQQNRTI